MPYGNNALSKQIRRNKRQYFIKVAQETKKVADNLTFDLSSYFRVQYLVMFGLKTVPFNLKEFVVATYYLQKIGEKVYASRLHDICPHIKKTTVENLHKYDLIVSTGSHNMGRGSPAKTFVLKPELYEDIDKWMKAGAATIRDANFKARKKALKNTIETTETDTINTADFSGIFEEYDEL